MLFCEKNTLYLCIHELNSKNTTEMLKMCHEVLEIMTAK